ncbi:hypothetical protein [Hyphobacterium sp.]|uniref:hypothetical protein n=1 Tax=Hyphobacterium sp. TaxID=2004662 RepID=UPI003BAD8D9F
MTRAAGLVMAIASGLSILFMAHHPTGIGGPGINLNNTIHAGMMIFVVVMLAGWTAFTVRRGLTYLNLVAIIAYALSVLGHLGAALISGFLTERLATVVAPADSRDLFALTMVTNRVLAEAAIVAASIAFLFWSIDLLIRLPRQIVLAGLGLVAGVLPVTALLFGWLQLDIQGAFLIYGMHALFTGAVGIQLTRRKL